MARERSQALFGATTATALKADLSSGDASFRPSLIRVRSKLTKEGSEFEAVIPANLLCAGPQHSVPTPTGQHSAQFEPTF